MAEFYGSLQDIGLPEIVSFLKGLNKTGDLRISQGRWTAEATVEAGQIKAASFGQEQGVAALEATMLALAGGSFTFADGVPSATTKTNVDLGPDALQARLAAFDTERTALAAALPSLGAVPRVAKSPGTSGEVVLDGAAIETLIAVNGERSIADIAHAHGIVATARELSRLLESGLISIDLPEAESAARTLDDTAETESAKTDGKKPSVIAKPPVAVEPVPPAAKDQTVAESNGHASLVVVPLAVQEAPPSAEPARPPEDLSLGGGAGVELAAAGPCPKLGYVDDPANRYSRPTQLHRCFANGTAERVSTPEQRDLCLTNRFPTCPRFIAAGATVPPPAARVTAPVQATPPVEPPGSSANGPEPQVMRNGGSSQPLPARDAVLAVRAPGAATQPSPVPPRAPQEEAPAVVAEDRPAQAPAPPAPVAVTAPPTATTAAPSASVARKFAPALLLVTALAVGTLAFVVNRASSPLPEVSDADVTRLATAVANNPGAGMVPVPPAASPPGSGALTAPMRTAMDVRFSEPQVGWPNNPSSTAWWADGEYHLLARQPRQFVAIGAPSTERFSEMVISATFRKVAGPAGGGYGLIIRDQGGGPRDGVNQNGQYYVLEVGDRGEYGIWRREGDRWLDLIPWTSSELVPPGNVTNEVTVQASGQELTFLVNGRVLANLVGAVLRDGGVGIFVGGDLNEVVVERFLVQTP